MTDRDTIGRLSVGDVVTQRVLYSIDGREIGLPHSSGLTHLQFRRFAGCPFCNLHLRSFAVRDDEIMAASVHEVVVFHSSADDLLAFNDPQPFPVIGDPDRVLYREFRVERRVTAVLHPGSWWPAIRGVLRKPNVVRADHGSGHLGLPADFLIDSTGTIVAAHYGTHAYDQWSVDELLATAAAIFNNRD